jgi:hypothetical protein
MLGRGGEHALRTDGKVYNDHNVYILGSKREKVLTNDA